MFEAAGIDHAAAEDTARRGGHPRVQDVGGEARPGGSSWQSLQRGTRSIETDYLNGEIVMLGRLHGVATPANERLQTLARELAASGSEPGPVDADSLILGLPGS